MRDDIPAYKTIGLSDILDRNAYFCPAAALLEFKYGGERRKAIVVQEVTVAPRNRT